MWLAVVARCHTQARALVLTMTKLSKDQIIQSQRDRIVALEERCRWAADQFEQIAAAIGDNSSLYAQAHAQKCVCDMEDRSFCPENKAPSS